jgi:hypothetical protein
MIPSVTISAPAAGRQHSCFVEKQLLGQWSGKKGAVVNPLSDSSV